MIPVAASDRKRDRATAATRASARISEDTAARTGCEPQGLIFPLVIKNSSHILLPANASQERFAPPCTSASAMPSVKLICERPRSLAKATLKRLTPASASARIAGNALMRRRKSSTPHGPLPSARNSQYKQPKPRLRTSRKQLIYNEKYRPSPCGQAPAASI